MNAKYLLLYFPDRFPEMLNYFFSNRVHANQICGNVMSEFYDYLGSVIKLNRSVGWRVGNETRDQLSYRLAL